MSSLCLRTHAGHGPHADEGLCAGLEGKVRPDRLSVKLMWHYCACHFNQLVQPSQTKWGRVLADFSSTRLYSFIHSYNVDGFHLLKLKFICTFFFKKSSRILTLWTHFYLRICSLHRRFKSIKHKMIDSYQVTISSKKWLGFASLRVFMECYIIESILTLYSAFLLGKKNRILMWVYTFSCMMNMDVWPLYILYSVQED